MAPQMVTALRKSEIMNDGAQFEETRPVWNHDLSGPVDKVIDGGIICFNRLKNARRVAPRYAKLAATFLAFVQFAALRLWLCHFVNRI
jgi:hypothetical protein